MFTKFIVSTIADACDCPFYRLNTEKERKCFFKSTVQLPLAMAMMDRISPEFHLENWESDCGGTFKHCSFIPLLYTEGSLPVESVPTVSSIEDYEPFNEDDDAEDDSVSGHQNENEAYSEKNERNSAKQDETEIATKQDEALSALKETPGESQQKTHSEASTPSVRVSVHKVSNPFLVKADVLIYPANNLLLIDDPYLNRMSQGRVQALCDQLPRPILMGNVYVTTNGGSHKGGVVAPLIYHAVVAGASRLVNIQDITLAVRKALLLAEASGAHSIAMLPCDCGTHDLTQVAMAQLAAVRQFLRNTKTESIQRIFLVMEDDESVEAFEDYFGRIFD